MPKICHARQRCADDVLRAKIKQRALRAQRCAVRRKGCLRARCASRQRRAPRRAMHAVVFQDRHAVAAAAAMRACRCCQRFARLRSARVMMMRHYMLDTPIALRKRSCCCAAAKKMRGDTPARAARQRHAPCMLRRDSARASQRGARRGMFCGA